MFEEVENFKMQSQCHNHDFVIAYENYFCFAMKTESQLTNITTYNSETFNNSRASLYAVGFCPV